jgi:hypothetical protein
MFQLLTPDGSISIATASDAIGVAQNIGISTFRAEAAKHGDAFAGDFDWMAVVGELSSPQGQPLGYLTNSGARLGLDMRPRNESNSPPIAHQRLIALQAGMHESWVSSEPRPVPTPEENALLMMVHRTQPGTSNFFGTVCALVNGHIGWDGRE